MTIGQQMYLAVVPPPEVIDAIDDLPTRAQRGVRFTKRDHWHITLKFLGASDEAAACAALEALDASATEAVLGPAVSLLGNRILMIPATGLDSLAAASATMFAGIGEPQPDRPFTGHLTLARLKGAPLRDPSTISVLGAAFSSTFAVTTVALVKNDLTRDGTTRTVVAEKQLLPRSR